MVNNTSVNGDIQRTINLRKACANDVQYLVALRHLTMHDYLKQAGMPTTIEDYKLRINYNFDDANIIMVDGQDAGLFKASFLEDKNQWYVYQVQVHPDFQGLGVGSAVIKQLIDKATSQGASVGLSVIKSNPALQLYLRLGFKHIEETDCEYEMVYCV